MEKTYVIVLGDLFDVREKLNNYFLMFNDKFELRYYNKPKYCYDTIMTYEDRGKITVGFTAFNKYNAFRNFKRFYYFINYRSYPHDLTIIDSHAQVMLDTSNFKLRSKDGEVIITYKNNTYYAYLNLKHDWYELLKIFMNDGVIARINDLLKGRTNSFDLTADLKHVLNL